MIAAATAGFEEVYDIAKVYMNRTKKLVLAAGLTMLGGTAAFGDYARGYFNNWADDCLLTGTTVQYKVFGTTEPDDIDYMAGNAWHYPSNTEPYASETMRTPLEVALGDHPYVLLGGVQRGRRRPIRCRNRRRGCCC